MPNPVSIALEDPWGALQMLLDGPLHPGGAAATEALLDRAAVGGDTRLIDIGCGAGEAVELAAERGAAAVGLDADPAGAPPATTVRGTLEAIPFRDDTMNVVLAECVLCLADDLDAAVAEAARVLAPGGRLALSDVVVRGEAPDLPSVLAEPLCLTGDRRPARLATAIEKAGLSVVDRRDHPEDLLAMRDRIKSRVDYERLLGHMGERGQRLLKGVERLETAVEEDRVGYVSLVASA